MANLHDNLKTNMAAIVNKAYCICVIMLHSYLNDTEIPGTKRAIPKGFELGTRLSRLGL